MTFKSGGVNSAPAKAGALVRSSKHMPPGRRHDIVELGRVSMVGADLGTQLKIAANRLTALDASIERGLVDAKEGRVHEIDAVAAQLDARYAALERIRCVGADRRIVKSV